MEEGVDKVHGLSTFCLVLPSSYQVSAPPIHKFAIPLMSSSATSECEVESDLFLSLGDRFELPGRFFVYQEYLRPQCTLDHYALPASAAVY